MPPIPSQLQPETLSVISSSEGRYKHIAETLIPELRKCIGPASVQQSLAEDVREATAALARQIDELDMMVDDQQAEKNRRELRNIVDDFRNNLDGLRRDTRAALLTSKRAIDTRAKSNREELLAFSATTMEKQTSSEKTTEDALMKANSDVTDALRRTIALMQSELERSVLSTQLLDESTATLRSTSLQHDALNNVMSISKQLVTALEKSDWLDRILILSGFAFFILVVLFILKQRILDRGLRVALWWTRFVPSFSDDSKLLRQAEAGMASAMAEASSSMAAAVTSLASTVVAGASLTSSLSSIIASAPTPDVPDASATMSEILSTSLSSSDNAASSSDMTILSSSSLETSIPETKPSAPPEHIEL